MKKLFIACAVSAGLLLGGCTPQTFGDITARLGITQSYKNPVGKRELAEVELAYQITAKAYVACKNVRCASVANLRTYQEYDRVAYAAIVAARPVVRQNPTVSGLTAVIVARQAVADFQKALGR